jgi:hypothetical protein
MLFFGRLAIKLPAAYATRGLSAVAAATGAAGASRGLSATAALEHVLGCTLLVDRRDGTNILGVRVEDCHIKLYPEMHLADAMICLEQLPIRGNMDGVPAGVYEYIYALNVRGVLQDKFRTVFII